jgi:hypothetical protein
VKASDLSAGAERKHLERTNAAPGLAATWRAISGAPEFGSAILGLGHFKGDAERSAGADVKNL